MRLRTYGDRALLCELAPHEVPAWQRAVRELPGVAEAVAGAATVLAVAAPGTSLEALQRSLADLRPAPLDDEPGAEVVLAVDYDGPDLAEVAQLTGLPPADVVELHAAGAYLVRFCGFSPGFAYLDGLDARLHVPRRAEPRTAVPAGSVAIAGQFAGVYPTASPGGWRLLGRTDAALWDVTRADPALLVPGTRVRFAPQ